MIRFSLACDAGHAFDGWFGSSDDYETQRKRGLLACPVCASVKVDKTLMTPSVGRKSNAVAETPDSTPVAMTDPKLREIAAKLKELRDHVTANADHVGPRFAEEARKIHYEEVEARAIYGEANHEEVESLVDEGVPIAPLPVLPEDAN